MSYINMDKKLLKKGGRNSIRILKEELLEELYNHFKKSYDFDGETLSEFDENRISYEIITEHLKVKKDLSKINFDGENYSYSKKGNINLDNYDYMGIVTLENGFTFLGGVAGGDWEHPVYHIVYFDGKSLRGYIPSYGNVLNLKYKCALGSEDEEIEIDWDIDFNWEAIIEDIKNRIIIKYIND